MLPSIDVLEDLVFSYFFVDIARVKHWLKDFFGEESRRMKFLLEEGRLDFNEVRLGSPYSGGREKSVALIFSPKISPHHCVFISNSGDGWYTLVNRICAELQCNCVSVTSTRNDVEYPANSFRVYENGRDVRYVRAMLDGDRWDYFEKGVIQPFENTENYRHKRIRDRLNRKIIIDYLRQIDLDVLRHDFWDTGEFALYIREQGSTQK